MSKFLRTAAMIVGAVALALTVVGAVAGAVGGSLIFGGTIASGVAGAAGIVGVSSGVLLGAAGLGLSMMMTKRPSGIAGGSQTEFSADPRAGVPYALGRTGTKGSIIFRRSSDGFAHNAYNDLMDIITILSGGGPIETIESFAFDKTAVTFNSAGNANGNYHDWMFQKTQLGQCPEAANLQVTAGSATGSTGWTAAHKLSGLAAAIWRLRYDSDGKKFSNGVPDPMWVVKGIKCYDPRKDSTYPGGSGSHRWNDRTTWEWSENPFLVGLTYAIGIRQNGKRVMGLGASADQIIVSQFVEGAGIAEANGWTVSGVIYSRPDTKWNNLKLILQAGGAEPVPIGARIGLRINTPRVSLATITREDIIGDATLATTQPRRSRINTVIPRYRSEAHNWEIVPAGEIQVASYVAEDGDERTREIEFPLVPNVNQAAALARYEIENSREMGPGTFPLKPVWANYKPGDCLTVDLDDLAEQKILVMTREIDPQGAKVTFGVRSETDAKHPFALGQTSTPAPTASVMSYDPSVAAPAIDDWTVSGTSIAANGSSQPAVMAAGSISNPLADAVIWDLRAFDAAAGDEENWMASGIDAHSTRTKTFTGLAPGVGYEVSVRYRVRGVTGARRILGPVTSGNLQVAGGAQKLLTKTVTYPVTSDDTSISIAAFTGVTDRGATIAFPSRTISSLASGTQFAVFWNTAMSSYSAVAAPATSQMANSAYVFIGWSATSSGGVYGGGGTAPGGWGGSGSGYAIP